MKLAIALAIIFGSFLSQPVGPAGAARSFYVSRSGSGGDGTSWASAWTQLDHINWNAVQPGDTIFIDGGPTACPSLGPGYNCGMVYNSALTIGKSGASGAPITIRLAFEHGRNGTVIIDGGLTAWGKCSAYAAEPAPPAVPNGMGTRETGINFGAAQWIVLDGTKWGGIEVRNHTRYGVNLSGSQRVLARYLKVHHNTHPTDGENHAVGVTQNYQSQYNTLARSEIFRNGQDAVRGAGAYFTLEENYLHDHYCGHPDGVQSFVPTNNSGMPSNVGQIRGTVIRRNVWDRIGMQTIFMGENATHNSWVTDALIHDNLFLNNSYAIKSKHGASSNWKIFNNTFIRASNFGVEWCCASPGARAPMAIYGNVFSQIKEGGSAFYLPTGGGSTSFSDNCLHRTGGRSGNVAESGTINTGDPLFVDPASGNYALRAGSPCAGRGSAITSLAQLLALTKDGAASLPPLANLTERIYFPMLAIKP